MKTIFIRKEYISNELRAPIVPKDIIKLKGFDVYVESCENRIYTDNEYHEAGAVITRKPWYHFNDTIVIGLKELGDLDKLNNHKHLYFSHCFKNQINSEIVLNAFDKSNSKLYDFELFKNDQGKRLISFGYYAGVVGCVLALSHFNGKDISNLSPAKFEILKNELIVPSKIKVAILGSNGNVASGVRSIIKEFDENMDSDILFNCILLNEKYNEVWFSNETVFTKKIIICDISCDNNKPNNPIKLYTNCTTWENPVYKFNEFVDIISIANLPSLMPKESSDYFSEKCVELLLNLNNVLF
jgi:saccharopine dehydrogenase (NAD+, L-lysine-forming)